MHRMNLDKREQSLLDQQLSYWGIKKTSFPGNVGQELQQILSRDPKEYWPSLEDVMAKRWKELGPLTLQDIAQNAEIDYTNSNSIGKNEGVNSKGKKYIDIGQLDSNKKKDGICRSIIDIRIQEGQCKNNQLNGFVRVIFNDHRDYYIG